MRKYFALFIAIMFCVVVSSPAFAMGGFFRNPCFDENGNRISDIGHCNDHNGGTKFVPMYEHEAGDESNEAPEAPEEPEAAPPEDNDEPEGRGECDSYSLT